jgi:hypothetical protein
VNLECVGCDAAFEAPTFRGYCPECIEGFEKQRENVHKRQRPAPGVIADGKFARGSPETVYTFCNECYAFLDFSEDTGE